MELGNISAPSRGSPQYRGRTTKLLRCYYFAVPPVPLGGQWLLSSQQQLADERQQGKCRNQSSSGEPSFVSLSGIHSS